MTSLRPLLPLAALSLLAALAACGDPSEPAAPPASPPAGAGTGNAPVKPTPTPTPTPTPAPGPSAADRSPKDVVDAYFVAARAKDKEAMLALGTDEWAKKEQTWRKAFTKVITDGKITLKTAQVRDPEVEGDTAKVSVGAVFVDENGRDDREGMNFVLRRVDGVWKIAELH